MRRTAAFTGSVLITATMITGCGESDLCQMYRETAQGYASEANVTTAQMSSLKRADATDTYEYQRLELLLETQEMLRDDAWDEYDEAGCR